ncbi:MAG: type IV secretory system conjugative DNA transfer family protein, partial [Oscillospiraceae bacterium]|nr:type IV secretory system conjugative DNA transfer family protein [Oscillospiraceae bacterium]
MHDIFDTELLLKEMEENPNDAFSLTFKLPENQKKRQNQITVNGKFNKEMCLQAEQAFLNSQMLLAENCSYSLNDQNTLLNHNALIVGASGTGKTTRIVSPNIEQAVGSYVISDPKGSLYRKYRSYLEQRGYT